MEMGRNSLDGYDLLEGFWIDKMLVWIQMECFLVWSRYGGMFLVQFGSGCFKICNPFKESGDNPYESGSKQPGLVWSIQPIRTDCDTILYYK